MIGDLAIPKDKKDLEFEDELGEDAVLNHDEDEIDEESKNEK